MDKSGSALIEIVLMPHMSLRRGYSAVLWGDITDEGSQVEHYLFIHPIYLSNRFCTPWTLSSNMASLGDAGDRYAVGVLGLWPVCFISFITHNRWQTSLLTNWDITQHFLSSFMLVALSNSRVSSFSSSSSASTLVLNSVFFHIDPPSVNRPHLASAQKSNPYVELWNKWLIVRRDRSPRVFVCTRSQHRRAVMNVSSQISNTDRDVLCFAVL